MKIEGWPFCHYCHKPAETVITEPYINGVKITVKCHEEQESEILNNIDLIKAESIKFGKSFQGTIKIDGDIKSKGKTISCLKPDRNYFEPKLITGESSGIHQQLKSTFKRRTKCT